MNELKINKARLLSLSSSGDIIDFNNVFDTTFSWSVNNLKEKNYFSLPSSVLHPFSMDNAKKALEDKADDFCSEFKIQGKRHYCKWHVIRHSNVNIVTFVGLIKDRFQDNNNNNILFQKIVDIVPHCIFWKDEESIFLGCNKAFAKNTGLSDPSEVIGKSDSDLYWSNEETACYVKDDYKVIKTGIPKINYEEEQTRLDGSTTVGLVSKVPLKGNNNNIIGLLGIYTDITDIKRKEKELKISKDMAEVSSQAKSNFIQNMSHDLRTPLIGMLTLSEGMVRSLDDDNPMKRYFSIIFNSSKQLSRLFESVLESAKLDIDNRPTDPRTFSVNNLISQIIELFYPSLLQKGLAIQLEGHSNDKTQDLIIGHPLIIERTLVNLISNASKFTKQGNITISYRLLKKNASTNSAILELCVSDTGIGIEKDKLDSIFKSFTRLSPSYEGVYSGQGLGLYIAQKMVRSINGTLEVDSKGEGQGATFTCRIPVTIATERAGPTDRHPLTISQNSQDIIADNQTVEPTDTLPLSVPNAMDNVYQVLLVEDNVVAQQIFKQSLEQNRCKVTIAKTVAEAIEYADKYQYDCIFMDVGLPDGDGRDATRAIRQGKRNALTPIIGLTAHTDSEIRQDCLRVGMNAIHAKPMRIDLIPSILNGIEPKTTQDIANHKNDCDDTILAKQCPVLDIQVGLKIMGGDKQAVLTLLSQFIESLAKEKNDIQQVMDSASTDKWNNAKKIIHRIRGGCGYCGAMRLQKRCEQFETAFHLGKEEIELQPRYQKVLLDIEELMEQYRAMPNDGEN